MRTAGPNAEKTIIYCRSINQVAAVYEDLLSRIGEDAWQGKTHTTENLGITMYHGSIGKLQEQYVLNTFVKTDSIERCVVCTIAFGMGIQVTDVRHIINFGPSKSPLHYWQEVGRAGRDGLPSSATLLLGPRSLDKRLVNPEMLKVCARISSEKCCARRAILVAIHMQKMPRVAVRSSVCGNHCSACVCEACCCCSLCRSSCPCRLEATAT
ncbi:PREDICTED: ATP-dependent DNA helicase RecQ-like [Priapulus caudatus]|uniref:DNA 3'-5' helicase n=1 Tax=Priapulus caudatus TaxID=37621 RepID=A0ABM1F918_PRICU|nr:PREDICTED: ATP-dependent DNA helicase RecQ-like [Priapulus caudatus]